jgi:8-oxo-dGTP pyrophosphatase MutT (NUDIX family)
VSGHEAYVKAAGGVVTRPSDDGDVEVLVVHRPRHGDWSLPKGKLERGESFEHAAVREVEEETGVRCALGTELRSHSYIDRNGRDKVVRYYEMTPVEIQPREPDDEVDEVRWVAGRDAARLLSYHADQQLVADVMRNHRGERR